MLPGKMFKAQLSVMNNSPVVIVTGASRGLGAAVAGWLVKAGTGVTLVARSEGALKKGAENLGHLGGEVLVCDADISDYDDCCRVAERTLERFGRIDSLVNNAGIVHPIAAIADSDPTQWRYNIDVNLIGPFNLTRAAITHLRKQNGRIINVSSGAANLALENLSAYCTGKAALNHFTRVLAAEESVLTALTVRPGVVDTDMQTYIRQEGPGAMPAEQLAYYRQLKDHGQLEPPEIPARSIAWLALYATRPFSGQFLDYDDPHISSKALEVFGERLT
jgi:NAD(P)-dependent dehydrogenase (short-subunit alcohol dehydrogenase family)